MHDIKKDFWTILWIGILNSNPHRLVVVETETRIWFEKELYVT